MLSGKTIIITGASSGIGEAAARQLAADGANIVLGARRAQLLNSLKEELRNAKGSVETLAGDVGEEAYAADLVNLALSSFGRLDGAFNNAGVLGALGPITDMTANNWNAVVQTNLNSAFFAAKHQLPALKKSGGGSLVFTSTFVGHTIGLPGMAAYAASKAGLIGLTQCLAVEHGADNIRANALLPGGTKTPMAGEDATMHDTVAQFHALKRMAEPQEVADAARFLLSDQASFVTGSAMLVDGGNSITKM